MTISIFTSDNSFAVSATNDYGTYEAYADYSYWTNREPISSFGDFSKLEKLTELINTFDPNFGVLESGIIPPGLLYVTKNFLVFEKPPTYKNVSLIFKVVDNIDYDNDEPNTYIVPVPWQLYIVEYDQNYYTSRVRMHFMKDSLRESSQEMYMAPLPNLFTSGDLCRPFFADMDDIERYSKDIAGVMASAYDWIWGSGTNLDLTETIGKYYTMFQDNIENTILSKLDNKIFSVSRDSYYCSDTHVEYFFKAWEKFDLQEITDLNWPKNSNLLRFNDDFHYAQSRISEYLELTNNSNNSEDDNSECCEECYSEDDDDNHYECECCCHERSENYNMTDVYAHFEVWPPKGVTYLESLTKFFSNSEYHIPTIRNRAVSTRVISNIEDSLTLS